MPKGGSALPDTGPDTRPTVELGALGIDRGGHLLIARALQAMRLGETVEVRGRDRHLGVHLAQPSGQASPAHRSGKRRPIDGV
jgi:hypothetical protein